jgi:hypothetical protein
LKPCAECGHDYAQHAPDVNFPDALRCFHGAATGEGCKDKYDQRCKDYVNPEEL